MPVSLVKSPTAGAPAYSLPYRVAVALRRQEELYAGESAEYVATLATVTAILNGAQR